MCFELFFPSWNRFELNRPLPSHLGLCSTDDEAFVSWGLDGVEGFGGVFSESWSIKANCPSHRNLGQILNPNTLN